VNLDDFNNRAAPVAKSKVKDAELVLPDEQDDDTEVICKECGVEGSLPLPNGTCDTCGATWEGETVEALDDDFSIALDLLQEAQDHFSTLMWERKIVNKMGYTLEKSIRDLALRIDDLLDDYQDWNDLDKTS
jgi:hypothetical protein